MQLISFLRILQTIYNTVVNILLLSVYILKVSCTSPSFLRGCGTEEECASYDEKVKRHMQSVDQYILKILPAWRQGDFFCSFHYCVRRARAPSAQSFTLWQASNNTDHTP